MKVLNYLMALMVFMMSQSVMAHEGHIAVSGPAHNHGVEVVLWVVITGLVAFGIMKTVKSKV